MSSRRLPRPFAPAELAALRSAASPEMRAVVDFLHETGLRSAEARSITSAEVAAWRSPPWWCRRASCPRHSAVTRIVGKGDKERVVVLTPAAVRAARELLPISNGHLIRLSERGLRWKFEELSVASGVHVHAHRFRHTFLSELVESGVPIEVAADMAGHANVQTTRLYYEASERARREALAKRGRWLRRAR